MIATNTASSGAFVGDYAASNIEAIGFSIMVTTRPPNTLTLYIVGASGTNLIQTDVPVRASLTGVWTKIVLPLSSAAAGGWAESTAGNFASVLTNVKSVELRLAAPTPAPNTAYLIDDFFLATDSPILDVKPTSHIFPELLVGQSAQTTLLLTNAGTLGMTGTVRTVSNGYFSIVGSTNYILQAGATSNVTVQFNPATPGSFSDQVFFLSDGGSFAVAVDGVGLAPPQLAVTPASVGLGPVVTGTTALATFVATNSGGGALTGTAAVAGAPFAVASGASFILAGGGTTNIVVQFSPTAVQAYTGGVVFASNGGNTTNTVTGSGFDGPVMEVSPASNNFFVVAVNAHSDAVFVVTNRGSQALVGWAEVAGVPFSVEGGGIFLLQPGGATNMVVRFAPTASGAFSNPVTFVSNGGSFTGQVVGTGANLPILGVDPDFLNFGDVGAGTVTQTLLYVTNSGTVQLDGTATVAGATFSVVGGGVFSVPAGGSQPLVITFSPAAVQAYSNDLAFASNAGGRIVPLVGTGVFIATPALFGVSPGSHAFGSLPAYDASQTVFVVTNSGMLALTGTAAVAGAPFAVSDGASYVVAGGGWTNVVITFSPTQAGSYFDTVTFLSNGGGKTNALTGSAYLPTADSTNLFFAQTGGVFHLVFQVTSGAWYHVQASTNLLDPAGWFDIGPTNRATSGTAIYNETSPAAPSRIYRVLSP